MIIQINNPNKKVAYFDRATQSIRENIWDLLTFDRLRSANLMAHEHNVCRYIPRPDQYKEVLYGIVPIPPRSRWLYDGNIFVTNNNSSIQESSKADLTDLLLSVGRLLIPIKRKKIAVELSGGLDTSIIIGILDYLGVNPLLIGLKSDRYEFRTERAIQELFRKKFPSTQLIPHEENLPFKNLVNTPLHQLPSPSSVFHAQGIPIAKLCKQNEISILFTGMGVDALLCDSPNLNGHHKHPDSWFSWALDDNWFNESVYVQSGISCPSAASSNSIIQIIWSMRQGQAEDSQKWWARSKFASFLPSELVNFAYKADHNGLYLDGIWNAEDEIRTIFQTAFEITKFNELNQRSFYDLIRNIQCRDDKKDKLFLARASFANWINALARENVIRQ